MMHRVELINDYIYKRGYKSYLEIGVENPENCFNYIDCEHKISVDPYFPTPYVDAEYSEQLAQQVSYRLTSDDFFKQNKEKFDIIFIDALHTEEQCDKDVANALDILNPFGCIVLHDALPENERIQSDEAFENKEPWTGTVWKTVKKLIESNDYKVKVYYHDYGIAVIEAKDEDFGIVKKYSPKTEKLEYSKDFAITNMNIEYSFLKDDYKVSYYTPAYKSKYIEHVYMSLRAQTDPRWEWVVLDDSPSDYRGVYNIVMSLYNTYHDNRIKYYSMYPNSNGFIGKVKHRAVSLCEGVLVAELDHDDEVDARTTEILLKLHKIYNSDFYYSNTYAYYLVGNKPEVVNYPDGFAMGYGSYTTSNDLYIRWINLHFKDRYVVDPNINPKTIRHIASVANHIRVWKRSFIESIGSYNVELPHCDDYELIVRTFVNGGKITKIDMPLYYQFMRDDNSQYSRLDDIQNYVKAISNYYHKAIAEQFEKSGIRDYVYALNKKDCIDCVLVAPPKKYKNLYYNNVVSEKDVLKLLK